MTKIKLKYTKPTEQRKQIKHINYNIKFKITNLIIKTTQETGTRE